MWKIYSIYGGECVIFIKLWLELLFVLWTFFLIWICSKWEQFVVNDSLSIHILLFFPPLLAWRATCIVSSQLTAQRHLSWLLECSVQCYTIKNIKSLCWAWFFNFTLMWLMEKMAAFWSKYLWWATEQNQMQLCSPPVALFSGICKEEQHGWASRSMAL